MNCEVARERILIADPPELVPGHADELGRHLRDCASCRSAAATVVAGTNALAHTMDASPRRSADQALVATRQERRRAPAVWAGWVAAAAILAVLVLWRPGEHSRPPEPAVVIHPPSPAPIIEDSGGADIALFTTTDPDIVVVWLY